MSLVTLKRKLNKIDDEARNLLEKVNAKEGDKYRIGINGLGVIVLTDLSNMNEIASGLAKVREREI